MKNSEHFKNYYLRLSGRQDVSDRSSFALSYICLLYLAEQAFSRYRKFHTLFRAHNSEVQEITKLDKMIDAALVPNGQSFRANFGCTVAWRVLQMSALPRVNKFFLEKPGVVTKTMLRKQVAKQQLDIHHILTNVARRTEFLESFVFGAMSGHRFDPRADIRQLDWQQMSDCAARGYVVPAATRGGFPTVNWTIAQADTRDYSETEHLRNIYPALTTASLQVADQEDLPCRATAMVMGLPVPPVSNMTPLFQTAPKAPHAGMLAQKPAAQSNKQKTTGAPSDVILRSGRSPHHVSPCELRDADSDSCSASTSSLSESDSSSGLADWIVSSSESSHSNLAYSPSPLSDSETTLVIDSDHTSEDIPKPDHSETSVSHSGDDDKNEPAFDPDDEDEEEEEDADDNEDVADNEEELDDEDGNNKGKGSISETPTKRTTRSRAKDAGVSVAGSSQKGGGKKGAGGKKVATPTKGGKGAKGGKGGKGTAKPKRKATEDVKPVGTDAVDLERMLGEGRRGRKRFRKK